MTTEPIIIAPDGFTNEDIAKWMRCKLQCIDYLPVLHGKRERLMSDVKKLDAESVKGVVVIMFCSVSHFYRVSFITKERGREKSNLQSARNPNPNRADETTGGPLFLIMTLTISKGTGVHP